MKRNTTTRRAFLAKSIWASGGVILASQLVACEKLDNLIGNGDANDEIPRFLHGVGSFDPTAEAVMIWTRFTPTTEEVNQIIDIKWQVATDRAFTNIVTEGSSACSIENDFTVVEDVTGLSSNNTYYYRFMEENLKTTSVVGETITLPKAGEHLTNLKLAVCSCSNYPAGLFNVYDAIAKSDADIVIHLGDYIYEYGEGEYGTNENTEALKRVHDPKNEILSLEDYRLRYRQYRTDESLQLAHQKKPFIVVWDDHEITNDTYTTGAENHSEDEGSFDLRKQFAVRVHGEYLPIRTNDRNIIYRSFQFGNLANLVMLDTRVIGRDKQLSFGDYFSADGNFDFGGFSSAMMDPNRSILGSEQLAWAASQITGSNAEWQVIGQQVLMAKMFVPAELLIGIGAVSSGNATPEVFQQLLNTISELSTIKARVLNNDRSLTPSDLSRINTVVPYNLDAWDGYPVEREKLFALLNGKKTIVLAGDTHNAWNSNLTDVNGDKVGEEFACSSVTSPGFEGLFGTDPETVAGIEQAFSLLIDDLKYFDASRRGYVMVEFTSGSAVAEYRFVDNISSSVYNTTIGKTITADI
ncbi:alkaline phosphatase D family protein [Zobellia alginiliquefaciens]|uniref:alkaline phosphatase D family protein n=1 Tax=Zobellia alginiliquefaciens TaxID=3032586 RepID=UPI0023E40A7C|nr:alkaline phosphatase D family protein [Zobellia alginiliquefaciens]